VARMTIGFHTAGSGGNPTGIGDYVRRLDAAGIPVTIACADGDVGIGDALALMNNGSRVSHVLIFRVVRDGRETYAVPNYNDPDHTQAARDYWNLIRPHFNTNVVDNKDKVWIAIGNELDQNKADWLGYWALETAKIANANGFKVLAWNWAAGTPDYPAWETPGMLAYLRYAGANPMMAAIGVHEYSYTTESLFDGNGSKVGRYRHIYAVCQKRGIRRPVVFIKEFGYAQDTTVSPETFRRDMSELFRRYPDYPPAAKWYLGPWHSDIANMTQRLIQPLTELTLQTSVPDVPLPDYPTENTSSNPPPRPSEPSKSTPPRPPALIPSTRLFSLDFSGWGERDVAGDPSKSPATWYDVASVQVPISNGQRMVYWQAEGQNRFADGQPWNSFAPPEGVHRWRDHLPAHEHHFLNDVGRCYHIFGPARPFWSRFSQRIHLAPGVYRLALDLWGDWVDIVNGEKVAKPDLEHARIELFVGNQGRENWLSPTFNAQSILQQQFEVEKAGAYDVGFGILTVFATGSAPGANGCFLRSFTVERMGEATSTQPGQDTAFPHAPQAIGTKYVSAPAGLWLRTGPSPKHDKIRLLPDGTPVEVLAENEWDHIRVGAVTGFSSSEYLSAMKPDVTKTGQAVSSPDGLRATVWAITSVFESGRPQGRADAFQNLDGGIISYGKHQATLQSGNLGRVLDGYFRRSSSPVSQILQQEYAQRVQRKEEGLRHDARLKELLLQAAREAAMEQAQDEVFEERFYRPAVDRARQLAVRTPLGLACLYDTLIQGGLATIAPAVSQSLGVSAIGQTGPTGQIDEATWLRAFLNEREAWLHRVADRKEAENKPKEAKMLRNSTIRVVELRRILDSGNLDLASDFTVRGVPIAGLEKRVPVIVPGLAPLAIRLATGMNINPDAAHSSPIHDEVLRGLDWVRFPFKAADKKRTVAASFAEYDPIVQGYAGQGVGSLIVLNQQTVAGNEAPWREDNWPALAAAYAERFAAAAGEIAARYAHLGETVAYEIWNEGDNPETPWVSVFVPPDQFALVLLKAAEAIKSASPQSPIIFGGLSTAPDTAAAYVRACRKALGGALPVDAIGIHPYGRWPVAQPFDGWGFGNLEDVFAVLKDAVPDKPLWITEIGVPGGEKPLGQEHYPAVAKYLRDLYTLVARTHLQQVPVIIWFAWSDNMENAGIVTKDGAGKAHIFDAFTAVRDRQLIA
jgi:hypothetical protein